MKILILNGPNINMLGKREADVYGKDDYDKLKEVVKDSAESLSIDVDIKQSNVEGELVDIIQQADGVYDGIIVNPAAYTHYSVAILDAIKSIAIPVVEVHLSNIYSREEFRRKSVIAQACIGQICGFGMGSYLLGMQAIKKYISNA